MKITALLYVTSCTLVNRFPSFLVNVLTLSSRSKLIAAGSYERWYQTACVTFRNRTSLSFMLYTTENALFVVAQQPNSGLGRLIFEVSRSHTHTHTL